VTAVLTADPPSVEQGQMVTLHWSTQNAMDLDLEPEVGTVQGEGSRQVTLQQSTAFTLTAKNASETTQSTAFVSVTSPVVHNDIPVPDTTTQTTKTESEVTQPTRGFQIPRTTHREEVQRVEVDTRAVKSSITLGDFHVNRGEYAEAIDSYQKGLQIDPSNSVLREKIRNAISACQKENSILNESNNCGSR
jgi:hypothetical protein